MTKKKFSNKTDISTFLDLLGENQIAIFILGHLAIESVLVQLIEQKLEDQSKFNTYSLSFPQKVELCEAFTLIGDEFAKYLITLNQIRN